MTAPIQSSRLRPRSLAEVAERSATYSDWGYNVADFLHSFQRMPRMAALAEEPISLVHAFEQGSIADAYLAAIAVELARTLGRGALGWTRKPERYCRSPWFASPSRHMRATLLLESPAGFRERNLFVSANALSVA